MAKKAKKSKSKANANKITNVAIVLDSSGSMGSIRKEAVDAFNQQVAELKKPENTNLGYRVSLVTFNTVVDEPKIWDKSVKKIKPLKMQEYNPNGMTALLDAIGKTISMMEKLSSNKNAPKDTDVANLVIIITDGKENNSKEYRDFATLKSMIESLQKKNWTFTFMGANIDVVQVACRGLGIASGNTMSFMATPDGYTKGNVCTVNGLRSYSNARRIGGQSVQSFYDDKGGKKQ
jgi:uncharacterized protein YegL